MCMVGALPGVPRYAFTPVLYAGVQMNRPSCKFRQ